MEETQNQVEPTSNKRAKKKFVYLEKYDLYKEGADARMANIERSLNVGFVVMGILVVWIILITINH